MSRRQLHRKPPPPLDGFAELQILKTKVDTNTPSSPEPSNHSHPNAPGMQPQALSRASERFGLPSSLGRDRVAAETQLNGLYPNLSFENVTPQSFEYSYLSTDGPSHSDTQLSFLAHAPGDSVLSPLGDYIDPEFDHVFVRLESPRPKGPQELPEDCLLPSIFRSGSQTTLQSVPSSTIGVQPTLKGNSPFNPSGLEHRLSQRKQEHLLNKELNVPFVPQSSSFRKNSGSRKFQNLLVGGNSPSPNLISDASSLEFTNYDDKPSEDFTSIADLNQGASRSNSKLSERTYATKTSDCPYPVDDSDPIDSQDVGSWATPTRIPTLTGREPMSKSANSGSPLASNLSPKLRFIDTSQPHGLYSSSPELPLNSRSLLSSPTKGSINFHLRNDYASQVSESRSSRSPSPKKYVGSPRGKSPTRMLPSFLSADDSTQETLDPYYEESRMPRWSLIEHDDFDYYDDSFFKLNEEDQFDYSILPELPLRANESPVEQPDFLDVHKGSDTILHHTPTLRRKNDDLPPVPLNLPLLPFSSALLSNFHFSECPSVWSLKNIFQWCVQLTSWMHTELISQKELKKALIKLIAYCKPDIPVDLINRNALHIIDSFVAAGVLVPSGDKSTGKGIGFEINVSGDIQGVLVDLTDCYSFDESHKNQTDLSQKCYSSLCPINKLIEHENLMKNTDISELQLGSDWASHWRLTAQDMTIDVSESKRQSFLFDLIKFEQTFIQRAECFIEVAAPEFIRQAKIILNGQNATVMKDFEQNIFSSSTSLCSIHQNLLYEPLLRILVSDGKFIKRITDIADLYKSWSKEARKPLLAYMSAMPMIQDLLNNPALKAWDHTLRLNAKVKKLQVNGSLLLMSTFNSRYQQLPLQLMDVQKFFDESDEEYLALTEAIESIRRLGTRVNEMKVYADNIHSLQVIKGQLTWKSNIFQPNLHLNSMNRKLFFRGDLLRKGDLKINSSQVHMIALDNYILLTDKQKNQKSISMKISETPIPVDYLIVENREKEAPSLGIKSNASQNLVSLDVASEEVSSYPFKIRYAGRGKAESHTLITATEKDRQRWISVLQKAKLNATKRNLQGAPFNFKLIDNSFFAYEPAAKLTKFPILASNDPISILARESPLSATSATTFINRQVQCSEMFNFMNGQFHFLGTTAGVYCFDEKNIWKKIINMNNVTRLTVIPELNVVLVLANKMLRYFPLQLLINLYYEKKEHVTSYQISNESIMFYEFGQHLGLPTLIVAKKKNTSSTTFKVFVLQEDNNGILSTIEVVKKFYIQAECYGISIFNTSLAVHTQRGFEILDLQKLSPRTVPEFPASDTTTKKLDGYSRKKVSQTPDVIKKMTSHAIPLGMFKLTNNKEFLLVFSECAIFVNKAGKLSRSSMIRFDYRAKDIAFTDNNLFLVCEEVIEIWSISDSTTSPNKLAQVIPNKDIHLLNAEALTFRSVNPLKTDVQLIFRLVKKVKAT